MSENESIGNGKQENSAATDNSFGEKTKTENKVAPAVGRQRETIASTGASVSPQNKLRIIVPAILILCIAGFLAWYFLLKQHNIPVNQIEVSGRIESDDASVSAKTSGRIREITVREGDPVKAGQVIAVLDDDQLKAREEQAQAAVLQSETRITRAEQQIAVLNEHLNQSRLGIEQARLDAQGRRVWRKRRFRSRNHKSSKPKRSSLKPK